MTTILDRKGWACVRPTELTGTLVVALKDEDTYCPLVEEGEVTSCPDGCTCYMRTKVNTTIVDCRHAGTGDDNDNAALCSTGWVNVLARERERERER